MRVVIVDDETLARERLKRLLQEFPGYEVVGEAADGESALDRGPCLLTQIAVAPTRPGL